MCFNISTLAEECAAITIKSDIEVIPLLCAHSILKSSSSDENVPIAISKCLAKTTTRVPSVATALG